MMTITKKELEKVYWENSNKEASKKLGISMPYLCTLINNYGIRKKGRGNIIHKKINVIDK